MCAICATCGVCKKIQKTEIYKTKSKILWANMYLKKTYLTKTYWENMGLLFEDGIAN